MILLFLKLLFIAIEKENHDLFVIKVAVFWHDNNRRQGHRKIKYLKKEKKVNKQQIKYFYSTVCLNFILYVQRRSDLELDINNVIQIKV